jgi:PPM family protein phosphatase
LENSGDFYDKKWCPFSSQHGIDIIKVEEGVIDMEMVQRTDVGRVRDLNEDSSGLIRTPSGAVIAMIADGMGGHQAGELASRYAVETMEKILLSSSLDVTTEQRRELLRMSVVEANQSVYHLATQNQQMQGMGTTTIAVIADEHEVVLAHVGDSRAYMLHNDGLYQLTKDHTYIQFLKENGQITEEEAKNHPQRHMILRAVGTNEEVEIDIIHTLWGQADILLLCSDGLTTMVPDREIGLILSSTPLSLPAKADQLLERALDAGGTDNISLILLQQ